MDDIKNDPRYEIKKQELAYLLRRLARFLSWISDAEREDIMKALQEFIRKKRGH